MCSGGSKRRHLLDRRRRRLRRRRTGGRGSTPCRASPSRRCRSAWTVASWPALSSRIAVEISSSSSACRLPPRRRSAAADQVVAGRAASLGDVAAQVGHEVAGGGVGRVLGRRGRAVLVHRDHAVRPVERAAAPSSAGTPSSSAMTVTGSGVGEGREQFDLAGGSKRVDQLCASAAMRGRSRSTWRETKARLTSVAQPGVLRRLAPAANGVEGVEVRRDAAARSAADLVAGRDVQISRPKRRSRSSAATSAKPAKHQKPYSSQKTGRRGSGSPHRRGRGPGRTPGRADRSTPACAHRRSRGSWLVAVPSSAAPAAGAPINCRTGRRRSPSAGAAGATQPRSPALGIAAGGRGPPSGRGVGRACPAAPPALSTIGPGAGAAGGTPLPATGGAGAGCGGAGCDGSEARCQGAPGSGTGVWPFSADPHEPAPDFDRQVAAGHLLRRRVVVVAEPDAGRPACRCSRRTRRRGNPGWCRSCRPTCQPAISALRAGAGRRSRCIICVHHRRRCCGSMTAAELGGARARRAPCRRRFDLRAITWGMTPRPPLAKAA